jgi:hypothetical protein
MQNITKKAYSETWLKPAGFCSQKPLGFCKSFCQQFLWLCYMTSQASLRHIEINNVMFTHTKPCLISPKILNFENI